LARECLSMFNSPCSCPKWDILPLWKSLEREESGLTEPIGSSNIFPYDLLLLGIFNVIIEIYSKTNVPTETTPFKALVGLLLVKITL